MALVYIAFTAQKRPKTRPRTAAWTAASARNGNRWEAMEIVEKTLEVDEKVMKSNENR